MNFEELIKKHLTNLQERIKNELASKNIDASGDASKSLEVKGNQLLGNDYLYFVDQGRKPGKFPPSLINWVRQKLGLEEREAKQVDFLIRRKIAREGTEIFKDKTKGLQVETLVNEMLDELLKELQDEAVVEAKTWL